MTVIVCTLNAWSLIKNLVKSLKNQKYERWRLLVNDDKRSTDAIEDNLKKGYSDIDYEVIYENKSLGQARQAASKHVETRYLLHLDADFVLQESVLGECVFLCEKKGADGVIIPEKVIGEGFWTRCRAFEKELYIGDDMMESPRFFKTESYREIGGHDASLAMSEDKDIDIRFRKAGMKVSRCKSVIWHNERKITLKNTFRRKFFWAQSVTNFTKKHPSHATKQGMVLLRPAFIRNWKKLLLNPILTIGMYILKFTEGIAFLFGIIYTKIFKKRIKYKN